MEPTSRPLLIRFFTIPGIICLLTCCLVATTASSASTDMVATDTTTDTGNEKTEKYLEVTHDGEVKIIYYGHLLAKPDTRKTAVKGKIFYTTGTTTVPSLQSVYLLEHTVIHAGESVLDIGTGSGIQAIFAAQKASKVIATDIDATAVEDARKNIARFGLQDKIETRVGDLFGPVKQGEKFDVIICNIDYPYDDESKGLWKVHERFFNEVRNYMKPNARIYYQSGWITNVPKIRRMANKNKLAIYTMNMFYAIEKNRQPIVFQFIPFETVKALRANTANTDNSVPASTQ